MPNLQHLSLQVRMGDHLDHPSHLPLLQLWDYIRFPKLRALTMAGMNPPGEALIGFLVNMPSSVEHLTIARDSEWPIGKLLGTLNDPRANGFCSQLKRVSISGLHLDTFFDWAIKALTSLELLEIDVMDTVLHPEDSMVELVTTQVGKLRTLPGEITVMEMHSTNGYHPVLEDHEPKNQSWSQLLRRKSVLHP